MIMSHTLFIPPEQTSAYIDSCMRLHDFRPTVSVLAVSNMEQPEIALVQSKHETGGLWWPVQGGTDNEPPRVAAANELHEEIGLEVCPDWVTILGSIKYPTRPRDGYTEGKYIIACGVVYNALRARFSPNLNEISDLKTVPLVEFSKVMKRNKDIRPETAIKADFLTEMATRL